MSIPPRDAGTAVERFPPEDPREWLNRANSNLTQAETRVPGVYLEDLCFGAQQAAEKAIKAIFVARNQPFPYVHDLADLLTLLEGLGESIPGQVRMSARLTRYAVVSRYPGGVEDVSESEYRAAVAIARSTVAWAERRVQELVDPST